MTELAARAPFARRRREAPPHVADDDPPSSFAHLMREMAPQPGRLAAALRITACALIVILLSETFQVSNVALNGYLTFILFKPDANAAVRVTLLAAAAIVVSLLVTIVYFAATLGETALRVPLIAVLTFAAMFLARGSALGPVAMIGGIFMTSTLVDGDDVSKQGKSPYYPTNADIHGLPSSLFISSEEALVHSILFEALGVLVAVLVVVAVNKLTANDPETSLRKALADRIAAAAAFCAGEDQARHRLVAFAKAGTATLAAQSALLGKVKRVPQLVAAGDAVTTAVSRLVVVLLAFERLPEAERDREALAAFARPLAICEAAVRGGVAAASREHDEPPAARESGVAAAPLLAQVRNCIGDLRQAASAPPRTAPAKAGGFFKADAFTDPSATQFALKTTLALMACYIFMNLSDWPQISTCMTTCFVVSLETAGQSFFKAASRVTGAAIGAAIGFVAILYVMPGLGDVGQLLAFCAPVLFASAWVRAGGERINYIGQQMAFAFMLMVLQNYGPTLDYDSGRDRVVGILVGEIAVTVVFTQLWPVRVADGVRQRVGAALRGLATALSAEPLPARRGAEAAQAFGERIGTARGLLVDDPYEPDDLFARRGRIDDDVLTALQAVSVPLAIVAGGAPAAEAQDGGLLAHRRALADWLGRAAAWAEHGRDGGALARTLPPPPEAEAAAHREVAAACRWYAILDRELREVLHKARVAHGRADAHAS